MARVTIEDCLEVIPNRFELSLIASQRAKDIASGSQSNLSDKRKEKPTVIALREIAEGLVDIPTIKKNIVASLSGALGSKEEESIEEAITAVTDEGGSIVGTEVSEDELKDNMSIQSDEMIFAGENLEVDD